MIKKITISVPEELHSRLSQFKSSINVSSICAAAIEDEIVYFSDCIQEAKIRLGILTIDEARDFANKKGIMWATQIATHEELAFVAEWNFMPPKRGSIFESLVNINCKINDLACKEDLFEFIIENSLLDDLASYFDPDKDDEGTCNKPYIDLSLAFQEGVQIVWQGLKNELLPLLLTNTDFSDRYS